MGALLLWVGLLFLCRLESPLVEGVAKDFLKQLPRGMGALLLWVGLLLLCRLECPLVEPNVVLSQNGCGIERHALE